MIHLAFTCGFEQMEDPNYGQFMTKGSVCQRTVVQSHSFVNDHTRRWPLLKLQALATCSADQKCGRKL